MKLTSMTDYLMELTKNNFIGSGDVSNEILLKAKNYANFLKQPLKLEMFVPCDEDGDVLKQCNEICSCECDKIKEYRKAKEKVLFEDISVQNSKEWIEFYGAIRVYIETDIKEKMFSHVFREEYPKHKTIEELTKYDLTLTPNAIKQLEL